MSLKLNKICINWHCSGNFNPRVRQLNDNLLIIGCMCNVLEQITFVLCTAISSVKFKISKGDMPQHPGPSCYMLPVNFMISLTIRVHCYVTKKIILADTSVCLHYFQKNPLAHPRYFFACTPFNFQFNIWCCVCIYILT